MLQFPAAFSIYQSHCSNPAGDSHQRSLLGTALLIPPQEEDDKASKQLKRGVWVACVFTSVDYGKKVSKPDTILESTKAAMGDLAKQLKALKEPGSQVGELWAVKINSGSFHVPWQRTKEVLEHCGLDIKIVYPGEPAPSASGGRTQNSGFNTATVSGDVEQTTRKRRNDGHEHHDGPGDRRKSIRTWKKRLLQD